MTLDVTIERAIEIGMLTVGEGPSTQGDFDPDEGIYYARDKLADHVCEALHLTFRGETLGLYRYSLVVPVPIGEVNGAIEVWRELDTAFAVFPKVPLNVVKNLLAKHDVSLTARDFVDAAGWICGDDDIVQKGYAGLEDEPRAYGDTSPPKRFVRKMGEMVPPGSVLGGGTE